MIGNIIYLVYCEYQNGDNIVQTIHETFDGTKERMDAIRDYWKEKGMLVKEGVNGTVHVMQRGGAFFRDYYVVTRTLLK